MVASVVGAATAARAVRVVKVAAWGPLRPVQITVKSGLVAADGASSQTKFTIVAT
jgi:hypothetical protein